MAGILDNYQFDPQSYGGLPGWLGQILSNQPGQTQGFQDQLPQTSQPTSGVTLPQQGAESFGRQPDAQGPLGGILSGVSGLFPGQQSGPQGTSSFGDMGIGLLNHLQAGATNLTTGGNPIAGLINAIGGLATGQRTDQAGYMLQQQKATLQALVQAGVPPAVAQAAAMNPEILKTIAPQIYSKPEFKTIKNALGEDIPIFADPSKGTITYPGASGASGGPGVGPSGISILAPGVQRANTSLTGDDYLNQYSKEVQATAQAYLRGDQMPTGNPRLQGILPFAKTVATKYAADMGIPFSDTIYQAKRKMQTDLAASSNSSMGGVLSNGESAFKHLAEFTDSAAGLGNYAGPNIPGGAHIGELGNYIGNAILPTPQTRGKLTALRDNVTHYGQESTKFYSATGGGEAERLMALKEVGSPSTNAESQAAFADKEKHLMLDRLQTKFSQIRDTLGETEGNRVIAQKMPELEKHLAIIDANIAKIRGGPANENPHALPAPDANGWITLPGGVKIREKK